MREWIRETLGIRAVTLRFLLELRNFRDFQHSSVVRFIMLAASVWFNIKISGNVMIFKYKGR